jgi:outer membrane protein
MKKILLLLCICLILPISAQAEDAIKIATLDVQKVFITSEAGKKANSDLEALRKSKQAIIDEKGKAIDKLKDELDKQASVLSLEAKKNKEDELAQLLRDYQRTAQDSQAELKKKEAEKLEAILTGIHDVAEKIGKEEGYLLILERGLVIYSNKEVDITDKVLKEFNKTNVKTE